MVKLILLSLRFIGWGIFMAIAILLYILQRPLGWISRKLHSLLRPNENLGNLTLIAILLWLIWVINEALFWITIPFLLVCHKLTPKNKNTFNQKLINEIINRKRQKNKV